VADPEFHNGGTVEGEGAVPPPQKNIEFLPENGGFWCILGLLFTFMQKLVRPMGGGRPPGSATAINAYTVNAQYLPNGKLERPTNL